MHIVIIGGGKIGISIAEWLLAAGNEVAIIDTDPQRCKYIDNNIGMVSVLGDGTNWDSLTNAGITRCDTIIATTPHDYVNLIACQLAIDYSKELDNAITTIAVLNQSDKIELFNLLGINTIININETLLKELMESFSVPGLKHLMPIPEQTDKSIISIRIPREVGLHGVRLGDTNLLNHIEAYLVITTDGSTSHPTEETMIKPGDQIVAVTTADIEDQIKEMLVSGPYETQV